MVVIAHLEWHKVGFVLASSTGVHQDVALEETHMQNMHNNTFLYWVTLKHSSIGSVGREKL